MQLWQVVVMVVLLFGVIFLLTYLLLLRRSLREVAEEMDEKLKTDTNTLVSISTGDRAVRALAAQINVQLQALRRERLRLQNGDAALKAAVTNISHDLRTPLTAICGYLDLLEREPQSEKTRRYLAVLRERTDAMCGLTEQMLAYSVVTAASDDAPALRPVCLNDLLEQSLAGFYAALSLRGIVPDIQLPDEKIIRQLDDAAVRRIFDNILSNAVKYSDGDLRVSLTAGGEIVFANHAAELGGVEAERLFDRFYTVETGRRGAGLGLSIARLLTERMGGSVSLGYRDGVLSVSLRFPETAS